MDFDFPVTLYGGFCTLVTCLSVVVSPSQFFLSLNVVLLYGTDSYELFVRVKMYVYLAQAQSIVGYCFGLCYNFIRLRLIARS